jgi:hypothetical protein
MTKMAGVTYLSDLPELDALDSSRNSTPYIKPALENRDSDHTKYKKFLRSSHGRPVNPSSRPNMASSSMLDSPNIGAGGYHNRPQQSKQEGSMPPDFFVERYKNKNKTKPAAECSCRDVYDHIQNCPICQAFYMQGRNNAILYIIIVALIALCLFLGKKVYDSSRSK